MALPQEYIYGPMIEVARKEVDAELRARKMGKLPRSLLIRQYLSRDDAVVTDGESVERWLKGKSDIRVTPYNQLAGMVNTYRSDLGMELVPTLEPLRLVQTPSGGSATQGEQFTYTVKPAPHLRRRVRKAAA